MNSHELLQSGGQLSTFVRNPIADDHRGSATLQTRIVREGNVTGRIHGDVLRWMIVQLVWQIHVGAVLEQQVNNGIVKIIWRRCNVQWRRLGVVLGIHAGLALQEQRHDVVVRKDHLEEENGRLSGQL